MAIPDLEIAIEGLEPQRRFGVALAYAYVKATQLGLRTTTPTSCAEAVVKYLGMARDLVPSLDKPTPDNHPYNARYQAAVYGIRDFAMGQAEQRIHANSDGLMSGERIPEGTGPAAALVRSSADEVLRDAQAALTILLAYEA